MEVLPGIHRIEVPLSDRVLSLYLLVGPEHALLIDTGMDSAPRQHLLPYLDSIGLNARQIRYAIVTHSDWDHQGGNVSLREVAPHTLLMCHEMDRPLIESIDQLINRRYGEFREEHGIDDSEETKKWIRANNRSEVVVDVTLTGGESIDLGGNWRVQVWHTPGHSLGHLTIYDPRSRAAIIADAVLWNCVPTREGKPAFPPTYRFVETYLSTIHFLKSMPVEVLLTAHYPILRGGVVAEFLAESRTFADRLDSAVRQHLSESGRATTTRELVEHLSPRLGGWPAEAGIYLVFPLVGHLEHLHRIGAVEKTRRGGLVAWQWKS